MALLQWVVRQGFRTGDDRPTRQMKHTVIQSLILTLLANLVTTTTALVSRSALHPSQLVTFLPLQLLGIGLSLLSLGLYILRGNAEMARFMSLFYSANSLAMNWSLGFRFPGYNYMGVASIMVALLARYSVRLVAVYMTCLTLWVCFVNMAFLYGLRFTLNGAEQQLPPVLELWVTLTTSAFPIVVSGRAMMAFHRVTTETRIGLERAVAVAERYATAIAALQLELHRDEESDGVGEVESELETTMRRIVRLLRSFLPYIPESVLAAARTAAERDRLGSNGTSFAANPTTSMRNGVASPNPKASPGAKYEEEETFSVGSSGNLSQVSTRRSLMLEVGMRVRSVTLCALRLPSFYSSGLSAVGGGQVEGSHRQLLQELHGQMVAALERVTRKTGGVPHFVQGDSALVSFNAVTELSDHKVAACTAALQLLTELPLCQLALGSGHALVGNIGTASSRHFDFLTSLVPRLRLMLDLPSVTSSSEIPSSQFPAPGAPGSPSTGTFASGGIAVVDQTLFENVRHNFVLEPFEVVAFDSHHYPYAVPTPQINRNNTNSNPSSNATHPLVREGTFRGQTQALFRLVASRSIVEGEWLYQVDTATDPQTEAAVLFSKGKAREAQMKLQQVPPTKLLPVTRRLLQTAGGYCQVPQCPWRTAMRSGCTVPTFTGTGATTGKRLQDDALSDGGGDREQDREREDTNYVTEITSYHDPDSETPSPKAHYP